ncbi:MAG TPA: ABC transporter ATP-binding protein, partial [Paenibacillus sp.]|nr:ABC transporter ATP-binding protein [Paenibacillus sp.]
MSIQPILEINALSLVAKSKERLVNNVSFSLGKGESLGLVGESGSGKSLTLRAILGLLPNGVEQTGGTIKSDVSSAMVFEDPRG